MAVASLTERLDDLYTTTWALRRAGVADQVFDATPFWYWMKDKGAIVSETGGRRIEQSLSIGKSQNISWIGQGSTVPMADQRILTVAYYEWRYVVDSIVRFMVEEQKNAGKSQILKLMNQKMAVSERSLIEEFETRLFGAESDDVQGNHPPCHGLKDLVADDPTTGVIGGIDASTVTYWRNKTKSLSGQSFAVNGFKAMQRMLNDTMNNIQMDKTDIIVCGQDPYEYYDADVIDQRRVVNKTLGDKGFTNVQFKGTPLIWSSYAPASMYFLSTTYLEFVYDPRYMMEMTDWKPIPNQPNDRVAQIVTAGNFVTNRRRVQGVIHTINTP